MYYLPINISDRRIHICELQCDREYEASGKSGEPVFGFLFTSNTLFATDSRGDNELVAFNSPNIELKDYHLETKKGENTKGLPTYEFFIVKNTEGHENHVFGDDFPFVIDPDSSSFGNSGIKIVFRCRGNRKIVEDNYVIKLHYYAEGEDYYYSFKGHNARQGIGGNITDAAIDFGSEASQISIGGARININQILRDNFYSSFHRLRPNVTAVKDEELWQHDKNESFYKSSYFVHKSPKDVHYADAPNKHGEKTFVQSLLPLAVDPSYYDELVLLPNLKLLDILGNNNDVSAGNITTNIAVPKESDILYKTDAPKRIVGASNMTDVDFRQNTLRVILCNMLHCILKNTNADNADKRRNHGYLRIVILMPNVYDQKKVYDIVEGMYMDFDSICAANMIRPYDGLEVSVISESDAAFLGAVTKYNGQFDKLEYPQREFYLIVDAGKGTTDFSIMHTSDNNLCVWNSLYRGGLPASGHALTYAVYEAIWEFFKRVRNVDIDDLLRGNKNMSTTKDFMDCLEEMKRNFSSFKEVDDEIITKVEEINGKKEQLAYSIPTLEELNINIRKRIIAKGYLVKHTPEIVKAKASIMANIVVKGIEGYMNSQHKGKKFGMVILTGRGFMLKPFVDAIKSALKGLTNDKTIYTQFDGDALKTICLDGSINIGGKYWINNNSELVCKPNIEFIPQNFLQKMLLLFKTNVSDDEFFYSGIPIHYRRNVRLRMGLGVSLLNDASSVHFVGRGLLVKTNNGNDTIDPLIYQQTLDPEESARVSQLTLESLFPYHSGAIPAPNTHKPQYGDVKSKSDEEQKHNDESFGIKIITPKGTENSSFEDNQNGFTPTDL